MGLDSGRLLLILISRDAQSAAQLAQASGLGAVKTLAQIRRLLDEGFIVAGNESSERVYRLTPKDPPEPTNLQPHILLVEHDLVLRELVVQVLEDEGFAVIAAALPVDAVALMERVSFDLVITDGFSAAPSALLTGTQAVLQAAGVTPVALFSAHTVAVEQAHAAGFRALITKPFDLDTLISQVRVLLAG